MEVSGDVILRFLDRSVDILQGLAIHTDVQIDHRPIIVHIRIFSTS